MKKILIISILSCIISSVALGQYQINLIMSATPPATLSEWNNRREALTLMIGSQAGLSIPVKIRAEIKTVDGTSVAVVDLARAKTFVFQQPTTILYAADVVPLEFMMFTGKYRESLQKTGKLPAGNYTLCVQLVTATDYRPVSEERCRTFYLATTQLPILMKPYNEEVLDAKSAQTAIIFRWSPVVPRLAEPVIYRIQVWEVLSHQTAMQALRSNQPLLDQQVTAMTQYIWRPQLGMMDCCPENDGDGAPDSLHIPVKLFIWTIQSLDAKGDPVTQTDGNGEARSEPLIFYIREKQKRDGSRMIMTPAQKKGNN